MYQMARKALDDVMNDPAIPHSSMEIAKSLKSCLEDVFQTQGNYALMRFSYGPTPLGREEIRTTKDLITKYKPEPLKLEAACELREFDMVNPNISFGGLDQLAIESREEQDGHEEEEQLEDANDNPDDRIAEENFQDDNEEDAEHRVLSRNLGEWTTLPPDQVDNLDFFDFMTTMFDRRAEAEARYYKHSTKTMIYDEYYTTFSDFIYKEEALLKNRTDLTHQDDRFWQSCVSSLLRDLALRFMSITSSEADVERVISVIRQIRSRFNQSSNEDLVKARILIKLYWDLTLLQSKFQGLRYKDLNC
ncbi:hypothetical protein TVAG_484510 [Trichomonas vaginalis G3]|uniref:Uncharacterized protein n=1 Tax=Trichomonas vaginalis (strain ATCC PRA-98 / G3) TaxID=412133 RepID=A2F1X9_TRIV3|nr:hypothetical protein TVAG_484510 [Trichomonas vaginalis G3]|eukprot:XP_001313945.1 hypothetical protein [Trichomonas vaginalis G3]